MYFELGMANCPRCHRPIQFCYGLEDISDYDGYLEDTFECKCGQVVKIAYEYDTPSFYAYKVVVK